MKELVIHRDKIVKGSENDLTELCPFSAIEYSCGTLEINSACRMCGLCVKKGPEGVFELVEISDEYGVGNVVDKSAWQGIAGLYRSSGGKIPSSQF